MTQQQLAERCGVSYQYISGIENGKENVTLAVLEALSLALGLSFPSFVLEAFTGEGSPQPPPRVNPDYFREGVPLPPRFTYEHLAAALDETHRLAHLMNFTLRSIGGRPLAKYIQGNNFSGIVSNLLCDSLNHASPYKHHSGQAYPDLICDEGGCRVGGLEVKSTVQIGKGGESHNGHSGWHLVGCFTIHAESGDIRFIHVMVAELIGHSRSSADWKYLGSKANASTGSQRTETYVTTLRGTTKLRDGSVYLDPNYINFSRWKQDRETEVPPAYSIFFKD